MGELGSERDLSVVLLCAALRNSAESHRPVSYTHLRDHKYAQQAEKGHDDGKALPQIVIPLYGKLRFHQIVSSQHPYAPVSYTHLDVYKRQAIAAISLCNPNPYL